MPFFYTLSFSQIYVKYIHIFQSDLKTAAQKIVRSNVFRGCCRVSVLPIRYKKNGDKFENWQFSWQTFNTKFSSGYCRQVGNVLSTSGKKLK